MKGLIFSEFLEYVETTHSPEMVDDIIDACDLASGGAYTTVGSYHHQELIALSAALSERCGISTSCLLREFGKYLVGRLIAGFPHFTHNAGSTFELLDSVEDYMCQEVRKLYPDAKIPTFNFESSNPNQLILIYRSSRPFADLAYGMVEGVVDHFGEDIEIECDMGPDEKHTSARFSLTLKE